MTAPRAHAAAISWTGAGDSSSCAAYMNGENDWECPDNWSTNSVPGINDDVTINTGNKIVYPSNTVNVNSLTIGSSYSGSYQNYGTLNVTGAFSMAGGYFWYGNINAGSFSLSGGTIYDGYWNIANDFTITGGDASNLNSASVDIGGNFSQTTGSFSIPMMGFNVAKNFTYTSGNFYTNGNYITFDGSSDTVFTPGNIAFYGISTSKSSSSNKITLVGTLNLDGSLDIGGGNFDMATNNASMTISGYLSIYSGALFTKGTGLITFDGASYGGIYDSSAVNDLGRVKIDGTSKSVSANSDVNISKLEISSTSYYSSSMYTTKITGSGTGANRPLVINTGGTLDTMGYIMFTGSDNTEIQAGSYPNLYISPTANNKTFTLGTGTGQTFNIYGSLSTNLGSATGTIVQANTYDPSITTNYLSVDSNSTFEASTTADLKISGFSKSGTFTHNNGTLTIMFSGYSQDFAANSASFYNVTINNTDYDNPGTITLQQSFTVESNLVFKNDRNNASSYAYFAGYNNPTITVNGNISMPSSASAGHGELGYMGGLNIDLKGDLSVANANMIFSANIGFTKTTADQAVTLSAGNMSSSVMIDKTASYKTTFAGALNLYGLTVNSGTADFTANTASTVALGSVNLYAGAINLPNAAKTYTASSFYQTGGTFDCKASNFTLSNSSFYASAGTFKAPSSTFTYATPGGDFNYGGTFDTTSNAGGTVKFQPGAWNYYAIYTNGASFNNVYFYAPADGNSTYPININGNLTINGSLTLKNENTSNSSWSINGSYNGMQYPDVVVAGAVEAPSNSSSGQLWFMSDMYDSDNSMSVGSTNLVDTDVHLPSNYTQSGPTVAISGTCLKADGSTPCSDGLTVKLAINAGVTGKTATTSSGAWTISNVSQPAAGDILTVFIDGVADAVESTGISKYTGSGDVTGFVLRESYLVIGSADNQSIANTDFVADSAADEDIVATLATADLTVAGGVQILAGNTYAPAGNISVAGGWLNSGTYTKGSETVTFGPAAADSTIDNGASSFNNVEVASQVAENSRVNDDFTAASVDAGKWMQGNITSYNTVGINAGRAELISNSFGGNPVIGSTHTLSGDFDVQVDYDLSAANSPNTNYVYLALNTGSIQNTVRKLPGGSYDYMAYNGATIKYDSGSSDATGKLRVIRSGSTYTLKKWTGGAWVTSNSYTGESTANVSFSLMMYNPSNTYEVGYFDNLVLNSGTIINNLAGNWDLNDNTSSTAIVDVKNGNNGTLYSSTTAINSDTKSVAGQFGTGITLDGTDDYISIPDSNNLDVTGQLTMSMWFKKTRSEGSERMMFKNNNSGAQFVWGMQMETPGKIQFLIGNAASNTNYYMTSAGSVSDLNWHYYTVTYDSYSSVGKIYIDGTLDTSATLGTTGNNSGSIWTGALQASTGNLLIGRLNYVGNPYYGQGSFDDVRVYNRVITSAEMTQLYTSNSDALTSSAYTLSNNLTVSGTLTLSAGTITAGANTLTVGNFVQTGGTFEAPSTNMNVSGNFTHSAGTFTHNSGSVNLTGAAASTQTVTGDTTFHDFSMTASAARTIAFASGSTQIVTGNWTATGATGQLLTLSGSANWNINPTTWTVDYVDVAYSTNLASSLINPTHYSPATLTANNVNWLPDLPADPSTVAIGTITTTGFTVTWTDNSSNETGFKVYTAAGNADCSLASYSGTPDYTTAADATSQAITGKSVNTQYCAKVVATNADGDSASAYAAPKYTLANAPSAPTVDTPTASSLKVTINVNSNPAGTEFAIYNDTASQYVQADGTLGASAVWQNYTTWGGASGIVNTGLTAATSYDFKVKARNGDTTETALSATGTASTSAGTPTAPTNATIGTITTTGFTITWTDNSSNETGFKVYTAAGNADCSAASYSGTPDYTTAADATSQAITGKSVNVQYCAKVIATNGSGDSAPAYTAAKYTLANAPLAPTVTTHDWDVTNGNNVSVVIDANSNPAGTEFAVSCNATPDSWLQGDGTCSGAKVWKTKANWETGTVNYLKNLASNTLYSVKVEARNGDNTETADSSAGTATSAPAQVTSLTHTANTINQISWDWADTTGATGYKIYKSSDDSLISSPSVSNYDQGSLATNAQYSSYVRANNGVLGQPSSTVAVYTSIEAASGITFGAITTDSIVVSATGTFTNLSAGSSGLYITKSAGSGTGFASWNTNNNTLTNTGLSVNTQYTYTAQTRNGDGETTASTSGITKFALANVPAAPTVNTPATTSLKVVINQNSNPAGTEYAIYNDTTSQYVQADGTLGALAVWQDYTTWGGVDGVINSGLSVNTTYAYKVKARNGDSIETALSGSSTGVYTLANTPAAPTVNTATISSLKVIVNQNSNPAGTKYAIYNNTASQYVQADGTLGASEVWQDYTTWGGASGVVNNSLTSNTPYTYQVKARNEDLVETALSSGSSSVSTLPNLPTAALNVAIGAITTTGFTVTWTDNSSNETGFKVYTAAGNADCSLASYSGTPDYTAAADSVSQAITGKSVNAQYCAKVVATNGDGDSATAAYSAPKYTLANVPAAPTLGTPTVSAIPVTINVNSNPAVTTFAIKVVNGDTQYVQADGTLGASAVWQTEAVWNSPKLNSGLAVNTQYTYSVAARNGDSADTVYSSTASEITLANVPAAPTVSTPTISSLNIVINQNSNPAGTEYAIYNNTASQYVQADGSLGASAVWQDYTAWGTTNGIVNTGLTSNTSYSYSVKARNGDTTETALSSVGTLSTSANPPVAASGVSIDTMTTTGFTVSWTDNSSNETGFKVYTAAGNADCAAASYSGTPDYTAAADAVSQAVTGKSVNAQYCAKVVATNADGDASAAYATTPKYTLANVPSAPTLSNAGIFQITVKINENSNPAGTQYAIYNVNADQYVQANGSLDTSVVWQDYAAWGGASGIANTGLTSSTSYTYKVKARNGDSTETALSSASSALSTLLDTPDISGFVYTDATKTPLAANKTVAVSVNGGAIAGSGLTDASGAFTITNIAVSAGDTIAVFVNESGIEANLFTLAADTTSNIYGLELYTQKIVLRSESSTNINNTKLKSALSCSNCGSHLHLINPTSNKINFDEGYEVLIDAGKTFDLDGEVGTVGNINLQGSINLGSNYLTITGNLNVGAGSITQNGSTVTFSKTSGTQTITTNGQGLGNVVFSGGATRQIVDTTTINGTFTQSGGVLDLNTYNPDVVVKDDIALASGSITKGSGTLTLAGDLNYLAASGINPGNVAIGASPDTITLSSDAEYDSLVINTGDSLITNGYNVTVHNNIMINGTLDATHNGLRTSTILVGGAWTNNGTFTADNSTVNFDGGSDQSITGNNDFNNLIMAGTLARTIVFGGGSTTNVAGAWTVNGAAGQILTLISSDTNNWTINSASTYASYLNVIQSTSTGAHFCATYSTGHESNVGWTIGATNSCAPVNPSDLTIGTITTTGFTLTWNDNSSNETGFKVYTAAGTSNCETAEYTLYDTAAANATSQAVTGKSINTEYCAKLIAASVDGDSLAAYSAPAYTLANTPSAPTVSSPTRSSLKVVINPNSNPASVTYAISVFDGVNTNYLKTDGTLSVTPVYDTYANFGGADGKVNTGLSSATTYTYSVVASNGDNTLTEYSSTANGATVTTYTLTYSAGANGSIVGGDLIQTVDSGSNGVEVVATPAEHYHFVKWSDNDSTNPIRTDLAVSGNITTTATFAIDTFTLTYNAGAHGSISGTTPQTIDYGSDGAEVVAVPDTNYHFTAWSDGVLTAARTDLAVSANITVTANFAVDGQYTLTYIAGAHGSIVGDTPQNVYSGNDGTEVVATPATGYHFVKWSDNDSTNPVRTDTNVTNNITTTASFAIDTFTLTYSAGSNGTITGTTPQTVNYGANGSEVTATPSTGYHFTSWSDGVLTAARTDSNITADKSVTASFAINTYTLTYTAGSNGTIIGTTPQTVDYGANGVEVVATPSTGYHFTSWSDGVLTAARTDSNITADKSVTASFAINAYTLTYTANANGIITGTTPQTVNYGANGTVVTAVANTNYYFTSWSDGVLTAARTDINVMGDITVTASFAEVSQYTLTYSAGAHGSIVGTSPQTVYSSANGAQVVATPSTGYHFTSWSDGVLTAARTDQNVTGDITVTASFAINTYTLTYTANSNGTITGTTPQTVDYGANGSEVTAVPSANYHFVSWSDGVLTVNRTDSNITADKSVTATFAINTYTLTYSAGANGSIVGTSTQTVNHGANGSTVTATPAAGYHFVKWSDDDSTNPIRTDSNVTANITTIASFAINTYTLSYSAGSHGNISGTTPQTINHGANGSEVTAVADSNYHFTSWSDGVLTAARTDLAVAGDITVTASFAEVDQFTLTYTAGTHGTITGDLSQTIYSGSDGTSVTAVADTGYHFTSWSDGVLTAARTDQNVLANIAVTANFVVDALADPSALTLDNITTTGLTVNWTDNSNNETGFKVFVSTTSNANCAQASYPVSANYTTVAGIETQAVTGLSVNNSYCIKLISFNNNSISNPVYSSVTNTLANVPSALTINTPTVSSVKFIINENSNPTGTEFAIFNETANKYVKADGALGDSAIWQNYVAWGGVNGKVNTGLNPNTTYIYKVKARNGQVVETALSGGATLTTLSSVPDTLTATILTTTSVRIDWVSGGAETKFNVYKDGLSGVGTLVYSGSNLTYTDTIVDSTINYSYYVYSENSNGVENPTYALVQTVVAAGTVKKHVNITPSPSVTISSEPSTVTTIDILTNQSPTPDSTPILTDFSFAVSTNIVSGADAIFMAPEMANGVEIVKYVWDFGDGQVLEGAQIDHKYAAPGRYTVSLTVTDANGNEKTSTQVVDAKPIVPVVSNIVADGTSIVIEGQADPNTIVYFTIHSNPYEGQVEVDNTGRWSFTLANAKEVLGTGDHTIVAYAAVKLADETEIRGDQTKKYDFKVTVDDNGLKVEMKKTKTWQYVSVGLFLVIVIGLIVVSFRKRRQIV